MLSVFYFDYYDATDGRGGAMLGLLADNTEAGGGSFTDPNVPVLHWPMNVHHGTCLIHIWVLPQSNFWQFYC